MKKISLRGEKSLLRRILLPMTIVMVLQSALFLTTLFVRGAVSMLNENACSILSQIVINRKQDIEVKMTQKWGKLSASSAAINALYEDFIVEQGMTDDKFDANSESAKVFLGECAPELVALLRQNGVNGAFIIFAGENSTEIPEEGKPQTRQGLCIRDMDQDADTANDEDLLIERAPSMVVDQLGYPLNSQWTANYTFTEDGESRFYYAPLLAAKNYQGADASYLAYWCAPHVMSERDLNEVISYSIPLINKNGHVYAVLGVEILTRYFSKTLPFEELKSSGEGVYALCQTHNQELLNVILTSGYRFQYLFDDRKSIKYEKTQYEGCYRLESIYPTYGAIQFLQIYNPNTPFENERLAIVGIMDADNLFDFGDRILNLLILTTALSFAIGMAGIIGVSKLITRPIEALSDKAQKLDPQKDVSLDKIGIIEIDRLVSSIEDLGKAVVENHAKLSTIMHITGLSLGACEVDLERNSVFYTDKFFDVLGNGLIRKDGEQTEDVETYYSHMEQLERYFLEDEPGNAKIFLVPTQEKGERYIRLRSYDKGEVVLCIVMDVTDEFEAKQKIEHERDYDVLTDLFNRRAFRRRLKKLFEAPETLGIGAMIMMDIDNLKYVNDTFGHDAGDEYIRASASVLKAFSDERTLSARVSGDEFLMLLFGYDSVEAVRDRINQLRSMIGNTSIVLPGNLNYKASLSGGISWYPGDAGDADELIRYADFAMYQMKRSTKGEIAEFNRELYNRNEYILRCSSELNTVIEQKQIEYYLQPIVNIHTGEIHAYEALMRPNNPKIKTPDEILTVARAQGKLKQIERLTWYMAIEKFSAVCGSLSGDCKLFINSIPNYMLEAQDYETLREKYPDVFRRVVMELTEEDRTDALRTAEKMAIIRGMGIQIAIDDYGSGYNAQKLLLDIQPNYVKIDMNITRGIETDKNRQETVKHLLDYTKARGIQVIAEGVETPEEFYYIRNAGVDFVQGYILQPAVKTPIPLSDETMRLIRG